MFSPSGKISSWNLPHLLLITLFDQKELISGTVVWGMGMTCKLYQVLENECFLNWGLSKGLCPIFITTFVILLLSYVTCFFKLKMQTLSLIASNQSSL
jgi:hypothetical protein